MVEIAAGAYDAGCAAGEPGCPAASMPVHQVELSAFAIDATEVTQAAYQACMDAGMCQPPVGPAEDFDPVGRADHPVVWVNWQRALLYCGWAGKRLPTEAEWERAARGTDGRLYPWGDGAPTCELAVYGECAVTAPGPVGAVDGVSPAGAFDLAGNAAEWVIDVYDATYYATNTDWTDPSGPMSGLFRVVRGGSYREPVEQLPAWHRAAEMPVAAYDDLGFRCATGL
jgi:serine/threonine-protein kinase